MMMAAVLAVSLVMDPASAETAVSDAIVAAVRERVSSSAQVEIRELRVTAFETIGEDVIATPEPGARLQRPARFALYATRGRRLARVGTAEAIVRAAVPHVRAARPLVRGAVLAAGDVTASISEAGALPMRRLPELQEVVGARTVRDLAAGEVIAASMLIAQPLVRSGDTVSTRFVSREIDVRGQGIAAQSGARGDVIRIVNPSSRRAFKGRITGQKEVEVIE